MERYIPHSVKARLANLDQDPKTYKLTTINDIQSLTFNVDKSVSFEVLQQIIKATNNLTSLNLVLKGIDIRDYLKTLPTLIDAISGNKHHLQDLKIDLESPKLNHINDLSLEEVYSKLTEFTKLKTLDIVMTLGEHDITIRPKIIQNLCKLRRLESLKLHMFFSIDMTAKHYFQNELIISAIKMLSSIKEIVFDEPYQRNTFIELLPIMRERMKPLILVFPLGRMNQEDRDQFKKWVPQHKIILESFGNHNLL